MVQKVVRSKWLDTDLVDMLGREFTVGDNVVRATTSGRASSIEIVEVTKIWNGRVYVGGSKQPVNFPGRLLIVNQEMK
ncbi:MAG: hypothetical protein JHC33_15090 [Ignisphaera sp.]|nr:hypothetical protein [Ignisphaera sp.]